MPPICMREREIYLLGAVALFNINPIVLWSGFEVLFVTAQLFEGKSIVSVLEDVAIRQSYLFGSDQENILGLIFGEDDDSD